MVFLSIFVCSFPLFLCLFFFFLMIRRPPRSTLFPTRRSSDLGQSRPLRGLHHGGPAASRAGGRAARGGRSEEHTSELQSLTNLVCRLLLEKKKTHCKHFLREKKNTDVNTSLS